MLSTLKLVRVGELLSGVYTGKKTIDACRCWLLWQFEKNRKFSIEIALLSTLKLVRVGEPLSGAYTGKKTVGTCQLSLLLALAI